MGYCSTTPPPSTVHPALHHTTGSCSSRGNATAHCSSNPPATLTVHPRGSIDRLQLAAAVKESLDRVQLIAIDRSLGFSNAWLQCNRSGSVRAQRLSCVQLEPMPHTHTRTCMRDTRIARPPTSHRNRELPEIFLPLASTMGFSVMDSPKNVMQLRLRPAQDEKPIFCHDFLS